MHLARTGAPLLGRQTPQLVAKRSICSGTQCCNLELLQLKFLAKTCKLALSSSCGRDRFLHKHGHSTQLHNGGSLSTHAGRRAGCRTASMAASRHPEAAPRQITIRQPDDWHLHIRDLPGLKDVLPLSTAHFARAIIMPNLTPPIATTAQASVCSSQSRAWTPTSPCAVTASSIWLRCATLHDSRPYIRSAWHQT